MIIGDVILIRSRKPWRMLLSTDPSDNDSDRGCIRVLSAARRSPPLDAVLPEWCALIQIFLSTLVGQTTGSISIEKFIHPVDFPLFALALAQHYGLATYGLDVTDRLDVALFFALMKYERASNSLQAMYTRITDFANLPVLYILGVTAK